MTHLVVGLGVKQFEQYYESIIGTLDRKGDFKVHEEAVHGFCDAGGGSYRRMFPAWVQYIYGRYALWFA